MCQNMNMIVMSRRFVNFMKKKYTSADHKRKAMEAEKLQNQIYKKWGISSNQSKTTDRFKEYKPSYTHRSTDTQINSVEFTGGICSKIETHTYTGDLIKGITVLHKSCLQPIISQEQAIEAARMRR